MKKIIITIAVFTSWFAYGQNKEVPLEGNFSGQRCNGSVGLCTISQGGFESGKNSNESKFNAKKIDDFHFQLIVDRTKISQEEELRIVGKKLSEISPSTFFIVDEDFVLDNQTANAIGLKESYIVIPKGEYPMSVDGKRAYISFTVEKP